MTRTGRSDADGAGPLSRPFLRTLGMDRCVRPTYSKTMGRTYPALACPKCGGVQEDNFIYRNYRCLLYTSDAADD